MSQPSSVRRVNLNTILLISCELVLHCSYQWHVLHSKKKIKLKLCLYIGGKYKIAQQNPLKSTPLSISPCPIGQHPNNLGKKELVVLLY